MAPEDTELAPELLALLDASPDAVLIVDRAGTIRALNHPAEVLFGAAAEQLRGQPVETLVPPRLREAHAAARTVYAAAPTIRRMSARRGLMAFRADGAEFPVEISLTPVVGSAEGLVIAMVRDVTHARLIAQQLSHQATHDALTGLVNRAEFERRLARALASATEEKSHHALCFLDLDRFKRVNDACGHLAGDALLRQLSDLLRQRMRARDTLARLGGDEFGMLLEHCRIPKALGIAEDVRAAIDAYRFTSGGRTYRVKASIGIVPIRADSGSLTDVLHAADMACYLAKRRGGNRIQLHDPRQQAGRGACPACERSR